MVHDFPVFQRRVRLLLEHARSMQHLNHTVPLRRNVYMESFNGKTRNELLGIEISTTVLKAKIMAENYRQDYSQK